MTSDPEFPEKKDSPQKIIREVENLISLPVVCLRILEMINDPRSNSRDIEKVLKYDPPITAHVLRMANSPFYGLRSTIDTVSRAVAVIGTKRIGSLVLAASAMKSMDKLKNDIISIENFWLHSIYCGLIASIIGKRVNRARDEALFVSGLLHDIGQLVMFYRRGDQIKEAMQMAQDDAGEREFYCYEQEVLGYNHMQVGAELAKKWVLPETLVECIAYHHVPNCAINHPQEVAIIHIANAIANMAELNSESLDDVEPISPVAWETIGLDASIIPGVLEEARESFENTHSMLIAA